MRSPNEPLPSGVMDTVPLLSDENRSRIEWLFKNDEYDLADKERPDCHKDGHSISVGIRAHVLGKACTDHHDRVFDTGARAIHPHLPPPGDHPTRGRTHSSVPGQLQVRSQRARPCSQCDHQVDWRCRSTRAGVRGGAAFADWSLAERRRFSRGCLRTLGASGGSFHSGRRGAWTRSATRNLIGCTDGRPSPHGATAGADESCQTTRHIHRTACAKSVTSPRAPLPTGWQRPARPGRVHDAGTQRHHGFSRTVAPILRPQVDWENLVGVMASVSFTGAFRFLKPMDVP
jgi:hypothetical protein